MAQEKSTDGLRRSVARGLIIAACVFPLLFLVWHRFATVRSERAYAAARDIWQGRSSASAELPAKRDLTVFRNAFAEYRLRFAQLVGTPTDEIIVHEDLPYVFRQADPELSGWQGLVLRRGRESWERIAAPLIPFLPVEGTHDALPWKEYAAEHPSNLREIFTSLLAWEIHHARDGDAWLSHASEKTLAVAILAERVDQAANASRPQALSYRLCRNAMVAALTDRWSWLTRPLREEEMQRWWAVAERLGRDDWESQRAMLGRCGSLLIGEGDIWAQGARQTPRSRNEGMFGEHGWDVPLVWIRRPAVLSAHARILGELGRISDRLNEHRVLVAQDLAGLNRYIPRGKVRVAECYPGRIVLLAQQHLFEVAHLRARLLAWMLVLEGGARRDVMEMLNGRAGSHLRIDPSNGLPFAVSRQGDELVVRGLGFDGAEGPPEPPMESVSSNTALWEFGFNGDIEVRVEIPPALR